MPTCPMCSADVDDVEQHTGETHPAEAGGPTEPSTPPQTPPPAQ